MNVTVTGGQGDGYLTVWPCDQDRPVASNLNFTANQDVANLVTVRLSTLKQVCIVASAATHVLADLAGTYEYDSGSVSSAITPTRVLDTRAGTGAPSAKLSANGTLTLQVAGAAGVPSEGATAVTMNVTVTQPETDGYLTVWPCDESRPEASNLNFLAGQDIPNLVTVKLSASGTVRFFSTATTHLIADASMWYSPEATAGFVDVAPERVLDTRLGIGAPATKLEGNAADALVLQVTGEAGIPVSGVTAVTMNVTVTQPDTDGYLTVWPCDRPRPEASNLNFVAGQDVPNLVVVQLSATGTVCMFSTATTHVLADAAGYSTATPVTGWIVSVV
ncbi:MAG: hypothetical protein R2715_21700 [Ilumatobacteraceae bacterium]